MKQYLFFVQIAVSILLVIFILLQQRGTALGSTFGGGGGGGSYATRRGLQKKIYIATIVLASLFIILGLLNLLI